MKEKEMDEWKKRSIELIDKEIEKHEELYSMTFQNKKKDKHKRNIKFNEEVKNGMLEEYGWL